MSSILSPSRQSLWQPSDLEMVACDLCRCSIANQVYIRPDGLAVVQCNNCGLCYLNPRPNANTISRLYDASYYTKNLSSSQQSEIGYSNHFSPSVMLFCLRAARSRLELISSFTTLKNKSCLEIGCASGQFCYLLQKAGAIPFGIDISHEAIKHAKLHYPKVRFECIELASISERKFDLICAFEVIEHVLSPKDFLMEISDRLAPDGIAIVTTPNLDCGNQLGYKRWSGFHMSFEHLYFFNSQILEKYGHQVGLKLVEWLTDQASGIHSASPPMKPLRSLKSAIARWLEPCGLREAYRYMRVALSRKNSVFQPKGTGHNLQVIYKKMTNDH